MDSPTPMAFRNTYHFLVKYATTMGGGMLKDNERELGSTPPEVLKYVMKTGEMTTALS
jgi:hypothetical protein